jgi:DNA-binding SARP family transcriptional activator/TolB-like protein
MAETARVVPLRAEATPHRPKVLGGFRLMLPDGADATPKARKTRALLAFLLVTRKAWTRERLANLLWSDRADEQAKASLRQALYELRDLAGGPDPLLVVKRDEVAARTEAFALDLDRVTDLARRGDAESLAVALDDAQLDLLADLDGSGRDFDEWLGWERRQAREKMLSAAVEAGEAALVADRAADARRLADALERLDGLNEPAVRLGLAADRAVGDLSAQRRRYDRFARRLKDDIDAEPAPETQALLRTVRTSPERSTAADEAQPTTVTRRRMWWLLAAGIAATLLIILGALAWTRFSAPPPANSLAVLPFETPRGQVRDTYFGAGVSEAVLDLLARDRELKVVGSDTARIFGSGADPLATARGLGLGYVLQGEAAAASGRLAISARLVRARDGRVVWSNRYQRAAEDVFAVQNEIAAAVAQQLGARISAASNPHLATRPEVYDRYLQARSLVRERRTPALQEARRLLQEAVAQDPDYAPAFAALAQVTMLLADHPTSYGDIPIPEAQAEARRHARRALELVPDLGEAFAAYGLISLSDPQSLPFYARAVALEPQRPEYHRWLAQAYSSVGRETEALAEYRRSAALDPLLWISVDHLMGQLKYLGRDAEAVAVADRYIRLADDPQGVARVRGSLAVHQGRIADDVRILEAAHRQWPGERTLAVDLAKAWTVLGEPVRATQALPPRERVGRLALAGDADGLAREARRMGPAFWQGEPGYWAFADELVRGGHGDLLLQLYDAEFARVDDFLEREVKDLYVGPPLVAALNGAGREAEANAIAQRLMARLDGSVREGVPAASVAHLRAQLFALTGRRDQALEQLALAVQRDWVNVAWIPTRLADRPPFQDLRGEPRLAVVQADLDRRVNAQRAALGLPPLKN